MIYSAYTSDRMLTVFLAQTCHNRSRLLACTSQRILCTPNPYKCVPQYLLTRIYRIYPPILPCRHGRKRSVRSELAKQAGTGGSVAGPKPDEMVRPDTERSALLHTGVSELCGEAAELVAAGVATSGDLCAYHGCERAAQASKCGFA